MTHTESQMRRMQLLLDMFRKATDFDEQWTCFKSFLDALHSIADTDGAAREALCKFEIVPYAIVLRNIFHHQPLVVFGRHRVTTSEMTFSFSVGKPLEATVKLALVISYELLSRPDVMTNLHKASKPLLKEMLCKLGGNDIPVKRFMLGTFDTVQHYCRETGQYDERYDAPPTGYTLKS